ncbi:MAG: hypothetical protein JWM59_1417 [Verrucomicrobiales bacterium]|nr:hypothetical protein [Verrucomicrobiales bacterium]
MRQPVSSVLTTGEVRTFSRSSPYALCKTASGAQSAAAAWVRALWLKAHFPETPVAGISDGAKDVQEWLTERCDTVTLDFFHLNEYIHTAAAGFGDTPAQRRTGLACGCTR